MIQELFDASLRAIVADFPCRKVKTELDRFLGLFMDLVDATALPDICREQRDVYDIPLTDGNGFIELTFDDFYIFCSKDPRMAEHASLTSPF